VRGVYGGVNPPKSEKTFASGWQPRNTETKKKKGAARARPAEAGGGRIKESPRDVKKGGTTRDLGAELQASEWA